MAGLFENPQVPRLPTLLDELRDGGILIPDFQRPLEWDDERRLTLLDSVDKQMPIGAFLVWRTRKHTLRCLDSLGAFKLPLEPGEQIPRAYLLDGHQRLATLFAALSWTDDADALRRQGMRWPVYYDLEAESSDRAFGFHTKKGEPPIAWIPLYAILEPRRLFEHQKRLLRENKIEAAERAELLAERFKDYQIPLVPLVSEDLGLVTDSFVRVNTGGKPMRETNMLRALAYPSLDIESALDNLKAELAPLGWVAIDDQVLLNVLKAHWRLNVLDTQPRALYERLKQEGFDDTLAALGRGVRWAIQVLAQIGVFGPKSLPYAYQLIGLSDAAWRLGLNDVDETSLDRISRWFWVTTYGEYFTGLSGRKIRNAMDFVFEVLSKRGNPIPPDLMKEVTPISDFNFKATRTKALMLLTTTKIEDADLRRRTQAWFGEAGIDAVQKLFPSQNSASPQNRVVAIPEEIDKLRYSFSELRDITLGFFQEEGSLARIPEQDSERRELLLSRYLLPEDAPVGRLGESQATAEYILRIRRERMDALERDFLSDLGMVIRQDVGESLESS